MTAAINLDKLVESYRIDTVTEQNKRLEFLEKLEPHLPKPLSSVLELGSASGKLSALLADRFGRVVAVDGSARFLDIARATAGDRPIEFVHSMFETLGDVMTEQFDLLVMHHILEHVDDPVALLGSLRSLLSTRGRFAITVPNAHALSRQLAVSMGLLDSIYSLTPNDHHHGHQRVYDWPALERDIEHAGYSIVARHGLALKLFADFQNEAMVAAGILGDAQLHGLWALADRYRDVAGAIMLVLKVA